MATAGVAFDFVDIKYAAKRARLLHAESTLRAAVDNYRLICEELFVPRRTQDQQIMHLARVQPEAARYLPKQTDVHNTPESRSALVEGKKRKRHLHRSSLQESR